MRIDVADHFSPIAEHDDIAGKIEGDLADGIRAVLAGNCNQDVTARDPPHAERGGRHRSRVRCWQHLRHRRGSKTCRRAEGASQSPSQF